MIQLVRGNGTQIVYKHAILAIHPAVPIELPDLSSFGQTSHSQTFSKKNNLLLSKWWEWEGANPLIR